MSARMPRKFDMAAQTCNYCKGKGHRIHAMTPQGVYIKGPDGERVLACPVIVAKSSALPSKNVDEEFPALPGHAGTVSEATIKAMNGINGAIKDKKQKDWLNRKAQKEERERINAERENAKQEAHSKQMEEKYGPRWAWVVTNTPEDNSIASEIRLEYWLERLNSNAEEIRLEEEMEKEQLELYKKERLERKARRALMTPEEARQDKWEEKCELEELYDSQSRELEHMQQIYKDSIKEQKAIYKVNGWTWVERA